MQEIWKDIIDFPNYQVSNYGKIKSKERYTNAGIKNSNRILRKEKELKQYIDRYGYKYVILYNHLGKKHLKVHRLVGKMFLKNYSENLFVNHINGNKIDNYILNLEMVTPKENTIHAIKNGLMPKLKRDKLGRYCKKEKGISW